jgi:nardilysin
VAKLETSICAVASKLEIKLYGYNDKLPILLSKILSTLRSFSPKTDRFEVIFCGAKIVLLIGLSEC